MGFIEDIFGIKPFPSHMRQEVERFTTELIQIGEADDFLSERPGRPFNSQCRHIRTREIGKRLHEMGGLPLMEYVHVRINKKLGKNLAAHLEYAWAEIGNWMA
ncbi:MAG: hypothetical protein BGO78_00305 [Chloroflexi bacterium 44-23]|nr:MAG: hypothetical protein BGO78_00305 [Chloroflexi bacterium 44-23]